MAEGHPARARRRAPRDPPRPAGFGRSDKPTDATGTPTTATPRRSRPPRVPRPPDATAVVHDWGGPIGLRLAVEHAGPLLQDGGHGHRAVHRRAARCPTPWKTFRDFVERTEDLPVGFLVKGAVARDMPDQRSQAAYEGPVPDPGVEGRHPGLPPDAADRTRRCRAPRPASGCSRRCAPDERPKLHLWVVCPPDHPLQGGERFAAAIKRRPPPEKIENASHFLQEDARRKQIGTRIAEWLSA